MALTVTSRGTGTHNTGATTLVPGGRTATLAAGSMGVLCIALDNAGAGGAATAAPASWTDAKGNVWTRRQNALYDNGAASAGIEMAIYTAPITVALLTTDAGTITWDGGVSPVAKAWTWYEVIPSGANTVAYSTGGTIAGATAANAQVVTASVPVGDAVIAGYFSENVAAVTGDADATNGSWAAQQTATIGSTTSGVRIATQQKVQTTTPSTQSYDVTVASQDRIAGYIMLHEVVNTTVTPSVASLALATFAPTVSAPNNQLVTPSAIALAVSAFAPTVSATAHQLVTPTTAALATVTFAPRIDLAVIPPAAALVTVGLAPTVMASDHQVAVPTTASLSTATFAPTVSVTAHQNVVPATAALAASSFAPTVTASDHQTVVPGALALLADGAAPTVTASDHQTVVPSPGSLSLATFPPTLATPAVATPSAIVLVLTGLAPTVTSSDHQIVTPTTVALALSSLSPEVIATDPQVVTPDPVILAVSAFAPTVAAGARTTPDVAALLLATLAPDVLLSDHQLVTPAAAALALSTFAATVTSAGPELVTPLPAMLALSAFAPRVRVGAPPATSIVGDGVSATLGRPAFAIVVSELNVDGNVARSTARALIERATPGGSV
jgi:hypothetical protein